MIGAVNSAEMSRAVSKVDHVAAAVSELTS